MSFGKDSNVMTAVGSFRQMSHQMTQNQHGKKKGGGAGAPYFVDQFDVPNELINVRLVPGQYLQDQIIGDEETEPENLQVAQILMPFIKFIDHFDGQKNTGAICSAGPFANVKGRREPCRGCEIFWATVHRNQNGRLESSRMSKQNKYAFTVLDYSAYHKVPQVDRSTGQTMKNAQGEPYYNWLRCFGQGCDMCRNQNEWKQGNCTHWNMSYTSLQTIRGAESDIGKSCVVCGQQDCIISRGWMCGHCGAEVVDMSSTQLKVEELLKLTDAPYGCGHCGQQVLLKEVYQCGPCTQRGHQGVRASIFDVDLKIKGVPSSTGKGKTLQIMGWSAPYPLSPEMKELAKPVDLVARYAPAPMDLQIAKFGEVPVPQTQQAPQNQPPQQPPGRQPQTGGQYPPGAPQGYQPPQPQQPYQPPPGAWPPPPNGGYPPPMQQGFQPPPGGFAPPPQHPGFAPQQPQGGFAPPPQQPAPQSTPNPYGAPSAPNPHASPYNNPYAPR